MAHPNRKRTREEQSGYIAGLRQAIVILNADVDRLIADEHEQRIESLLDLRDQLETAIEMAQAVDA